MVRGCGCDGPDGEGEGARVGGGTDGAGLGRVQLKDHGASRPVAGRVHPRHCKA